MTEITEITIAGDRDASQSELAFGMTFPPLPAKTKEEMGFVPKPRWVVFGWEQIPRGSWGTRIVVKHDGEVPNLAMRGPMEGLDDEARQKAPETSVEPVWTKD